MVWVVVCGTALPVSAQFSPVQLTVQRITKKTSTGDTYAGTLWYPGDYSANMALRITVKNTTPQLVNGLTIRWGIVKSQVSVYRQGNDVAYGGEQTLDLKTIESKTVETDVVGATGKRFSDGDTRGEKIRGHGVQVLRDGKVIAEEFVPPTVKKAFENLRPVADASGPPDASSGKRTKDKKDKP
jgi:hypothetical protein